MGIKNFFGNIGKHVLPALPVALQAVTLANPLAGVLVQTAIRLEEHRRQGNKDKAAILTEIREAGVVLSTTEEKTLLRVLSKLAEQTNGPAPTPDPQLPVAPETAVSGIRTRK